MTVQSPTRDTTDFLTKPLNALGASALLVALFTFIRVIGSWQGDTEWSWMVELLPWLIVAVAAFVALSVKPTLKLALTAGATTLAAFMALRRFTAHIAPFDDWSFLLEESFRAPGNAIIGVSQFLEAVSLLLLMAATVWVIVAMRPYLLGPAYRASFGIDTTLLITVFALLALAAPWNEGGVGALFDYGIYTPVSLLSWVIPSVIVLSLFVRQGGALAVGSTIGLLVGTLILPWLMDLVEGWLGGTDIATLVFFPQPPDAQASIPLILLLIVTIWWALSRNVGGNPDLVTVSSNSPINATSIVAFCLAWFPLTSVPAVVLGHMAYDQIVDGDTPQRGLGLARWSIVFAYLSLFGGGFLIFNQLT